MQKYFFALVVLLVPLAHANIDYTAFAQCNQSTISQIQSYWLERGQPHNVLKSAEQMGTFTFLFTSYDHVTDDDCLYVRIHNGTVTFTVKSKNGGKSEQLTYSVEEGSDGVITGTPVGNNDPKLKWNWYPIYFADGIASCYLCSDVEGSTEPHLGTIMVSEKTYEKTVVRKYHSLMKKWGFKLYHIYKVECFQQ